MKPSAIAVALLLSIGVPAGTPLLAAGPDAGKVTTSASPILRFAQVDTQLYRGAQPDDAGFKYLKDMGIRTIVSFRTDNLSERKIVEALGMRFVSIPVRFRAFGWGDDFDAADVRAFFEVIDDPAAGPIFFHCKRGADRTGSFAAIYRIARQGWTGQKALDEARDRGMRWWYFPMRDQVRQFAKVVPPVSAAAQ
jgi:protein tyrosine/serine phosphatase